MQLEQIISDLQNLIKKKPTLEEIGQSLYYAKMTGKKPAVAIIIKKPTDRIYIERIKKVNAGIKIFEIKSVDYK